MWLLLPLKVLLLTAALLPATAATSTVWHKALVTQDQLTNAPKSETLQVSKEIICAIHASITPWCHLFTHSASDCVLYDLLLDSLADPPPDDQDAVACMTRHRNVCFRGEEVLLYGDKVVEDCLSHTCVNRVLVPTYNVLTCDGPFSAHGVGCVHLLDEDRIFCDARAYCTSLGGDLAVVQADKFQALQTYLNNHAAGKQVWVGVKERKWLDGREVDVGEWKTGEPNEDFDMCARMSSVESSASSAGSTYFLGDRSCSANFRVLCMRN